MYRKSNRKSKRWVEISGRRHIAIFGRQRPVDARFCSILANTTSGLVVSSWLASSVKVRVLQFFTALRRAVVVLGYYRKSNRKSGSLSRHIGSPPYFHFRFGRQRLYDARFCGILAKMAAVSFVMVRRKVQEVKVVRDILLPVRSRLADSRVVQMWEFYNILQLYVAPSSFGGAELPLPRRADGQ